MIPRIYIKEKKQNKTEIKPQQSKPQTPNSWVEWYVLANLVLRSAQRAKKGWCLVLRGLRKADVWLCETDKFQTSEETLPQKSSWTMNKE